MIIAKPLEESDFWILEDSVGENIGFVSKFANEYSISLKNKPVFKYNSIKELQTLYDIKFVKQPISKTKAITDLGGFPTHVHPYNVLWSFPSKCYVYTPSEKSTCFYAAGVFIIKEKEWEIVTCPKINLLKKRKHQGPFKNESEAKEYLASFQNFEKG